MSLDPGTTFNSRIQIESVGAVTLQKLFKHPKVTCPSRKAGKPFAGGVWVIGR